MSSIGRTPNYDLPRFLRGSVPQWTGDVGPAFDKIDEVLFAQGGEIAGALNTVEQMNNNLQNGLERVAQAESVANEAKESADATAGEVVHVKTDINLLSTWKTNTENRLNNDIAPVVDLNKRHIDNIHDWLNYDNMYKSVHYTLPNVTINATTAAHIDVTMSAEIPGFRRALVDSIWSTDNRMALSGYTWSNDTSNLRYFYNNTSNVQLRLTIHVGMLLFNRGLVWAEDLPERNVESDLFAATFKVYDDSDTVIQEGVAEYEIK